MARETKTQLSERGQALAESALLVGLVSLAAILVLFVIGDGIQSIMAKLGGSLLPPTQ